MNDFMGWRKSTMVRRELCWPTYVLRDLAREAESSETTVTALLVSAVNDASSEGTSDKVRKALEDGGIAFLESQSFTKRTLYWDVRYERQLEEWAGEMGVTAEQVLKACAGLMLYQIHLGATPTRA
ncbi:hypothetical protein [Streptomyces sp. MBT62]|uniref:hypothetical protein n=1 Tax=Streptomyces sp. MBT62 TaxID=2800410 RepID=UPI00190E5C85|nr:hypothetical protein [Streptomyces sp. MBT62]MBK3570655.1 hypothetical protein [Streptomyces sp. MBT62]